MLLLNSSSTSVAGGFEHRPFKMLLVKNMLSQTLDHESSRLDSPAKLQGMRKNKTRLAWREANQRCHRETSANFTEVMTSTGCNLLATGLQLCANGAVPMEFGPLPAN